ncbi:hypothetical protein GGD66_005670 [Bradyrhizobium sp. CIR48]|uniref:hypothetical protein n=1 Tax=Bradyrhizobium sp. CIR48 TaxID=2663840 RepID=UPI001605FCB8|nr:hypothetical protein [Bradyrhizobium sp. CIR48]MBB4427094.1 hypothetical protein [Bradyrhizobium sp. CIR48]
MTKQQCESSLRWSLNQTSVWRSGLAKRYFDDYRNQDAADRCRHIASIGAQLTDAQWRDLCPHFDPNGRTWLEALTRATREVGFRTCPTTFNDFADLLIGVLEREMA